MTYTVHGVYSKTGANVELGTFRSMKKVREFLDSTSGPNPVIYPIVVVGKRERLGSMLLSIEVFGYELDGYHGWSISCAIWRGHSLGYQPGTFDPIRRGDHGLKFWSEGWRGEKMAQLYTH